MHAAQTHDPRPRLAALLAALALAAACGEAGTTPPEGADAGAPPADSGLDAGARTDAAAPDATCPPGELGCACRSDGTCGEGAFCRAGSVCSELGSCEALRESGGCPVGRACAVVNARPTCLDTCEAGYRQDAMGGPCVACGAAGCAPSGCAEGVPGSLAETCRVQHQVCVEDGTGARCDACVTGFRANPVTGRCEDASTCGGRACLMNEEPTFSADGTCTCVERPCPVGEARRSDGTCVSCNLACGGTGVSARISPRTTDSGACLCETLDGFFYEESSGTVQACDGDGDGWVRRDAWAAMVSVDRAIRENARCPVRRAERVRLENDVGQRQWLWSCRNSGLVAGETEPCGGSVEPILLLESQRNDVATLLQAAALGNGTTPARAPSYGTSPAGRVFTADELNALTRACVTEAGDFDDDGTPDVAESQGLPAAALTNSARLAALTYFVELHTSGFEPGPLPTSHGTLVIRERSRCAPTFPLTYATASMYWRECHRGRDARFDGSSPQVGFDFASWSCAAGAGPCAVPALDGTTLMAHGSCSAASTLSSTSAAWRGMHHHSQFQCGVVGTAPAGSARAAYTLPIGAFEATSGWIDFNACQLGVSDPYCTPRAPSEGELGFFATRFAPGVTLEVSGFARPVPAIRGCVDEGEEFGSALCPAPVPPRVAEWRGDDASFGALLCECAPQDERTYFLDRDRDGVGDPNTRLVTCRTLSADPTGVPYVSRGDDCDDADARRAPTLSDEPDLGALDANCDGVDGDAAAMVFVAPGGSDRNPGTRTQPLATVSAGLAALRGARQTVAVAAGRYDERISLRDGVTIAGGYDPNTWSRTLTTGAPRTVVHATQELTLGAVVAADARELLGPRATVLQAVDLEADAAAAPLGTSTYGLRAYRSSNLRLEALTITAGPARTGARGADGTTGQRGANGIDGQSGGNGRGGGPGGLVTCVDESGMVTVSVGYNGGNGGRYAATCGGGNDGDDGDTSLLYTCGGGGGQSANCSDYTPNAGTDGQRCASAGTAMNLSVVDAVAASADGAPSRSGFWVPAVAPNGGKGAPGVGGGGGGGGGGDVTVNTGCNGSGGGGGGGGGSGGCGGNGGRGAQSGGGAFAVFAHDSPISFSGVRLVAGRGGDGGVGGGGGTGGVGGSGGSGGGSGSCGAGGGDGGSGQRGAPGGAGGAGAGGPSVALFACGVTTTPTRPSSAEAVLQPASTASQGGDASAPPGRVVAFQSVACPN